MSEHGVTFLAPPGAITPTGPWSVGSRAGDFVFVAGMRGIDPANGVLIEGEEARVRQAFANMAKVAASEGATLADCVRTVVYVTDMARHRPLANKIAVELWGQGPCPPRTIVEVRALNQGDFFEVEGTFYAPLKPG
jgi:enamine deaminase RidA (YjgF/YER057c/UK114 family)